MKKLFITLAVLIIAACGTQSEEHAIQKIKESFRQNSVQVNMYHLVWHLYKTPVPDLPEPDVNEIIKAKVQLAIEKERAYQEELSKKKTLVYKSMPTYLTEYGFKPTSRTNIPIGALSGVPEWVKFPQEVLVAYKIEKSDIKEWEKESEKDVLAISETANVSISIAKSILSKLRSEGYSISKEEAIESEEVELLYFDDGWNDSYPNRLNWSVKVCGTDENLVVGYDPRGILITRPIPEKNGEIVRVDVTASYIDLEDSSKPVPSEVTSRDEKIDKLKKELEQIEDELREERAKDIKPYQYDIRNATIGDLFAGSVQLEGFTMTGGGSGVFLGNMPLPNMDGNHTYHSRFWGSMFAATDMNGVVLTNHHITVDAIYRSIFVSENLEHMWIVFEGLPFVRYTHDSDRLGTPAAVLWYDGEPVMSQGVDAGVLVTTPIKGYNKYAAKIGDSDLVEEGTKVATVGNPGLFHKFYDEGEISNSNYSTLQSPQAEWLNHVGGYGYDILRANTMWTNFSIGIGGVSGSGIFALNGSQKGKLIALRNAGLMQRFKGYLISEKKAVEELDLAYDTKISKIEFEEVRDLFDVKDASFKDTIDSEDEFFAAMEAHGYIRVSGMNMAIPINRVKAFLAERGIDLGIEMSEEHWKH